jgi:flagellar FliL protein
MAEIPVLEAAPKADKGKADKAKADKGGKAPDASSEGGASAGGKKKLLIFVAIGVIVLGGAGAGAWLMLGGKHDAAAEKGKKEHVAAKEKKEAPKGPPLFLAMDPPFVVNFQSDQAVRFLQITVQVMTRDPKTQEELKVSDPIIRNDLLLLYGNQKYSDVATLEGKEKLRQQSLETVRKVVRDNGGEAESVEAVYFTSFVMQ